MATEGFVPRDVPSDLVTEFETEGNFEHAMERFSLRDSLLYTSFLRKMAAFFCRFEPKNDNHYVQLFGGLKTISIRLTFASLNYENIVELALAKVGFSVLGHGGQGIGFRVIKPHGSCGFLPQLGSNAFYGVSFSDCKTITHLRTKCTLEREEIERWCNDPRNQSIAPAMSFYAPGKDSPFNRAYIDDHREAWKKSCAGSQLIFVIGVECNERDDHIWTPLGGCEARVVFVNPSTAALRHFADWARRKDKKEIETWPHGFEDSIELILERTALGH